jgi:NAD(P)-dependent dehydrogenase (short-subunit alcohol dehydrogenase family)
MTGWDREDVPDQRGRVALVTGANSGIGLEAALGLAAAGAKVLLACRNQEKAADAVDHIRAEVTDADLTEVPLDLSEQVSVHEAAATVRADHPRLDLLIANAGVMAIPRQVTSDGFEMQLATNHLGHFALVGLLLDTMLDVDGSRVVVVSSGAHRGGSIKFDDLQGERRYQKWMAYGQSKLANLLFAYELQRRLAAAGKPTICTVAHPGYASTNLQAVGPQMSGNRLMGRAMDLGNRIVGQSAAMGALPTLYAATAPWLTGGELVGPKGPFHLRGNPALETPGKKARNAADAARLWAVSEELTGVEYPV